MVEGFEIIDIFELYQTEFSSEQMSKIFLGYTLPFISN